METTNARDYELTRLSRCSIAELPNGGETEMYVLLIRTGALVLAVVVATVTVVAEMEAGRQRVPGRFWIFQGQLQIAGKGRIVRHRRTMSVQASTSGSTQIRPPNISAQLSGPLQPATSLTG